jgi:hypothetical protein
MSKQMVSGSIAAAWLACGLAVAAQGTEMRPSSSAGNQAATASAITVAGCVQNETAVLKRSAVAGDAGMSDEFVLIQAQLNPKPKPAADAPAGTSGPPGSFGKVYRMTGDKEKELKALAGQRVEITGTFKREADAKAELAAGAGGRLVTGALTTDNTPEITITAIKPVAGSCGGAM